MEQDSDKWARTVFRVRGLPHDINTNEDVASLLSSRLHDISVDLIRVYSLATALERWECKIATVMFKSLPSLIQESDGRNQWFVPASQGQPADDLVLDTHFIGMTPMSDVKSGHSFEYNHFSCSVLAG